MRNKDRYTEERQHEDTHGEDGHVTEVCIYKPKNGQDCKQTPQARKQKEGLSHRAIRESMALLVP